MILLIVHVIFACLSIPLMLLAVVNELAGFVKNKQLLPKLSAVAFAGLVTTGTALIVVDHARILSTCLSGLLYLSGLSVPYLVFRRLDREKSIS
ncbi:MAG TPA: hypothetical protein VMR34_05610 [Candidatus Saccharimonadales bacterium]|nr:hypothetical protein [Candidatus Saccharimonadales bacterium]